MHYFKENNTTFVLWKLDEQVRLEHCTIFMHEKSQIYYIRWKTFIFYNYNVILKHFFEVQVEYELFVQR